MAEETNTNKETIAGAETADDSVRESAGASDANEAAAKSGHRRAEAEDGKDMKAASEDMKDEKAAAEDPEGECASGEEEVSPDEMETEEASGKTPACDEDVMDGSFESVEEEKSKGSFFRKKKDKRDEKIAELTDRVKRQMAEFDNFRKRTEKEKSQMFDLGARSVIEKILPVIDNFERGLNQAPDQEDAFVQGMEKIYKSMLQELESIGVKQIEAQGREFDPNLHNAVMHCEDDSVGENIVVQELQKGYTYHDSVVRHSMVKVAN